MTKDTDVVRNVYLRTERGSKESLEKHMQWNDTSKDWSDNLCPLLKGTRERGVTDGMTVSWTVVDCMIKELNKMNKDGREEVGRRGTLTLEVLSSYKTDKNTHDIEGKDLVQTVCHCKSSKRLTYLFT